MPRLRQELARAENAIVESNSVLRFMQPDVFVTVLDAGTADFKESAKRYLDRADAIVVTGGSLEGAAWAGVSARLVAKARHFSGQAGAYCSDDLASFVREKLSKQQSLSLR